MVNLSTFLIEPGGRTGKVPPEKMDEIGQTKPRLESDQVYGMLMSV